MVDTFEYMYFRIYQFYSGFSEHLVPRITSNVIITVYLSFWVSLIKKIVDLYIIDIPDYNELVAGIPFFTILALLHFVFFSKKRHLKVINKYQSKDRIQRQYLNVKVFLAIALLIVAMYII